MLRLPQTPIPVEWWRRFHATMTGVWGLLIIPTVLWWHDSVLWIGLISCYANSVGHFSAYQGSRAEASNGSD
jgi:hypothetical protein